MSMPALTDHEFVDQFPTELFIGGKWVPASGGATFTVEDPATELSLAEVADAGGADALRALEAASTVQRDWSRTPARTRAEILRRAFELMIERTDDLARLVTLEMGKPVVEARGEVAYAAEFFRWFSEEAVRIEGGYAPMPEGGGRMLIMKHPVGPSLFITPWNFPLAMGTRKIGPALAAGCTVIVKPAEQTPLSMLALAAILVQAGVPKGVVNVIPTSHPAQATAPLFGDTRLRKVSFTGSTEVGRILLAQAAPHVLRTSMELGGNAPFMIFEDADLAAAVDGAILAKMRNGGQACTAANRFFVHVDVAEEFATALQSRFDQLTVGRGNDAQVQVGPLIDRAACEKVQRLVCDAISRGARRMATERSVPEKGYFTAPTVLLDTPHDADILREEVFGPVAPIVRFADEDEAVALANDSQSGLTSYVFTRDFARALRVSEALESGTVGLNRGLLSNPAAPFGGMKQSGLGREGGRSGIEEFLETKYVALMSE
jgi:succinate-semialdehyde dehydrogenase/glutarate-semialdehyde dehydrogenase